MKKSLVYWIPTVLLALLMGVGGVFDIIAGPQVAAVLQHLGYPLYFGRLLGVAKLLGVVAIVAPLPRITREWAYAGFTFDLVAAIVSHVAVGAAVGDLVAPVVGLALVAASYTGWRRREQEREEGSKAPPAAPAGSS